MLTRRQPYRIVLVYNSGVIFWVIIKAKDRETAERKALRRHPGTRVIRS